MNKQEFTARVMAMENRLYRISCGMLECHPDRLDAVQETIFKAWANLNRLREERYFETWITRILINECHNIQSARRRTTPMENLPEMKAPPPSDEMKGLRDALAALNMDLRLPVLLYYMEGYKMREIAQILRIPEGTVKTRLARAKQKLKRLLEEEERR